MTPEAKIIAIALAIGHQKAEAHPYYTDRVRGMKPGRDWEWLPDYLSDLNAMHEVEATLSEMQCEIYRSELNKALAQAMAEEFEGSLPPAPKTWIWHAPASVRAVAFLRTLNLYTE